jgi:restriction system protein
MAHKKRKNSKGGSFGFLGVIVIILIIGFIVQHISIIAPIFACLIAIVLGVIYLVSKKRKNEEEERQRQIIEAERIRQQKLLESGIERIDVMKGEVFEEYLAVLFRNMGFPNVEMTPKSHDFGADIILTSRNGERAVVQAKRYERNVDISAIQQVVGAKNHYNATSAFVVTNQDFSQPAYDLAKSNNVALINRERLIEMSIKYGNPKPQQNEQEKSIS